MSDYTVVKREDAMDAMEQWPGFGEMRMFTYSLGAEQVALTWRQMPPDTGGRGSYGHSHKTQEELYLVLSGEVTFKLGDDVFTAGPGTAVRIPPATVRSIHNDGRDEAEVVICSPRVEDPQGDAQQVEDFWPNE